MPHKPKLPRSRCFYPAFNQSWAIHHVHIVLNNSETMLVSLVLHFNGKKKKNHMLIVQASQGCLAALLKLPKIIMLKILLTMLRQPCDLCNSYDGLESAA